MGGERDTQVERKRSRALRSPLSPSAGPSCNVLLAVTLSAGTLILLAVSAWQIKAVIEAEHPPVRAIEALAGFIPLFLILFASSYYLLALADASSFSATLTRTDALYFTLTVFSTVGFGDISAASQPARVAVMVQMIFNIILLGLGVRVLTRAVHVGVAKHQPPDQTSSNIG
jgi:CDP-diglyceride synthetase